MKRIISFLIAVALGLSLFTGCGAAEETTAPTTTPETTAVPTTLPPETTAPPTTELHETAPESGVYGNSVVVGNLRFEMPDDFIATVVGDNSIALAPQSGNCAFGLFAMDVSEYDESIVKSYLPQQHESFTKKDEDDVRVDDDPLDTTVSCFDITMDFYYDMAVSSNNVVKTTYYIVGTFTDSWYVYTFSFQIDSKVENLTDYVSLFSNMLYFSEYLGAEPRFDFVQ